MDEQCLLEVKPGDLNAPLGAPTIPPKEWFETIPDGADPRLMVNVVFCGKDKGRFWTMMAEDSIPYNIPFPSLKAAMAAGAESYYMNNRLEAPLSVLNTEGKIEKIAAGPIGYGHSPATLETADALYKWHDREWGTAAKERPLARARMLVVDGPAGNKCVVAAGALMPDVTWAEALAISRSEVSPEFVEIYNPAGELVGIEWITQTLVLQGNTQTSLSIPTTRAGVIRRLTLPERTPTMTVKAEPNEAQETTVPEAAATVSEEIVDPCADCLPTSTGPLPDDAEVSAQLAEALGELDAIKQERDELLKEKLESIMPDLSPLSEAT